MKIKSINRTEVEKLIARIEEAIEYDLALSKEDLRLLLLAIGTLSEMQGQLEAQDTTLLKLRKLVGIVQQSESRRGAQKKGKSAPSLPRKKPVHKSEPARVELHKMTVYEKGQPCFECHQGKLHKYRPTELLRVSGQPSYVATKHVLEQLRCNACLSIVTADLPVEVQADGDKHQQYGHSARAMMALHKFYSGTPYHHQENLSSLLGCRISASTVYDQCQQVMYAAEPVLAALQDTAANAVVFGVDDTHHRILEQQPEMRERRSGKGHHLRTGVYCSILVAKLAGGQEIALYETSLGHAGEHLDKILDKRKADLPRPKVMSDALSSNRARTSVIQGYCNAHCRRNFYDLLSKRPDIDEVLSSYGKIWVHEAHCQSIGMTPTERQGYHHQYSLPIMEWLKSWAETEAQRDDFEEHSAFGKAIYYLLRHYESLTQFCRIEGMPLDNNRSEERLKIPIRGRKTAHFHRTQNGAEVANCLISVIATADMAGVNVYDYLCALQRHRVKVREKPEAWLPWVYSETLHALEQRASPPDKQEAA